jgi:hypothetical protein
MKPVTINSKPGNILRAFKASGYWDQLSADLRRAARQDPQEWLRGHPYLYAWYPRCFRDRTGTVKVSEATVAKARKQAPLDYTDIIIRFPRKKRG